MEILFKSMRSGKRYKIKKSVVELVVGISGFSIFVLALSFVQNLAVYWGIATW